MGDYCLSRQPIARCFLFAPRAPLEITLSDDRIEEGAAPGKEMGFWSAHLRKGERQLSFNDQTKGCVALVKQSKTKQ